MVNPLLFPNAVMNTAAGQSAIRYGLKGVNVTVAGGQLSCILALRYAMMLLRRGHADTLLVGCVEEFSPHTAWGFHLAGKLKGEEVLLGEGCVTFIVESAAVARVAGRAVHAEILGCAVGAYRELNEAPGKLAACIQQALRRAGATIDQVWYVAGSMANNSVYDRAEEEGIHLALGKMPQHVFTVKPLLGECYSAAGAFQLATLLTLQQQEGDPQKQIALVTSLDHTGSLGCLVIRRR